MKNKLLLTLFAISIISLTACGTTTTDAKNKSTEQPQETSSIRTDNVDVTYEWQELGYMDNYPQFRAEFDKLLNNNIREDGTKTGICYVDLDMKHTNNSMLRYVFNIEAFHDRVWNNEDTLRQLNTAVKEIYADVETDSEARLAAINAYYNIFNTPDGYFNGSDTLTRAEFLTGVYKAHNPVSQLEANINLPTDQYNPFVNQMLPYSYLDLANNNMAYDGIITRGEAIYTLVKMYYGDLVNAFDSQTSSFTDAKCLEVEATDSKSTELSQALQNPDAGVPVEIYKALFVAGDRGFVGAETRWDEAITKAEVLEMLTIIYSDNTELKDVAEFNTTGTSTNNQQSENNGSAENNSNASGNSEQTGQNNQTNSGSENNSNSQKEANLHIVKIPNGTITGSSALKEAINSSLKSHGVSTNYQNDILVEYYEATVNKDNTKIHNDVIDNLVSSLASALKAQEQQNQNQNTGGDSNSNQNEENDSGVAEGYTPSKDPDPGPGETSATNSGVFDNNPDDGGDGGPIISDGEANTP